MAQIAAGRVIAGKFRLTRQLGQGGMGSVWAAVHETLGREVAVKFLMPQAGASPVHADRFVSEAHMVASIKHRFVVDVFDYGVTDDGLHYMVLELLHGRSLADRIDHGPPLTVRQAVRLMADCLRGLHVVHEAGIIHRDLKPDNIFVIEDADGAFPKLIDFGISRRTEANLKLDATSRKSRLTQPGTVLGTPYYMSPEQLRGKHNVDARSDLYGVGVILYELLVGRLPFTQDNVGDLMVAITITGAPSLLQVRPDLGEPLAAVVKRALAPTAELRYGSALELREALLGLLPLLPENALCAPPVIMTHGELTLNGPTQLEPPIVPVAARLTPSDDSLPPADFRVPQLSTRVWLGVASALALVVLAWTLARELSLSGPERAHTVPQVQEAPTLNAQLRSPAAVSGDSAQSTAAAPASESAPSPQTTGAAGSAAKPQRTRARTREPSSTARPAPSDRSQKLYRKLDF